MKKWIEQEEEKEMRYLPHEEPDGDRLIRLAARPKPAKLYWIVSWLFALLVAATVIVGSQMGKLPQDSTSTGSWAAAGLMSVRGARDQVDRTTH